MQNHEIDATMETNQNPEYSWFIFQFPIKGNMTTFSKVKYKLDDLYIFFRHCIQGVNESHWFEITKHSLLISLYEQVLT